MVVDADVRSTTEATLRSLHRLVAAERGDPAAQIVTSVTLVEGLVDQFIEDLVSESGLSKTRFGRKLIQQSSNSFHQSWEERNRWLNGGFGIALLQDQVGQNFSILIEVRNAIIHGNSQLTDRQMKNFLKVIALRKGIVSALGSELQGSQVVLGQKSGRLAVDVAIKYVMALDKKALAVIAAWNCGDED